MEATNAEGIRSFDNPFWNEIEKVVSGMVSLLGGLFDILREMGYPPKDVINLINEIMNSLHEAIKDVLSKRQ
ncbi:hypothetical protein [Xenorhabdus sp. PB62.4]|uniref:hypothetical protein n=1 Tax=Xenorhabdus sp. PB62.4 TaxID=1851573 RepID=UPI001656E3CC|nr:hypothetical protein [Xenorhabdus sp. PB62.4]MBC8951938.1 hypothetical protein [Xenorhabdus sp. PB62.4]